MENLAAKQMYFDYLGSHFGMGHDGVLDEYRRYGVSLEQEAQWRQELVQKLVGDLSLVDPLPVLHLGTMQAAEAIPQIMHLAPQGDSYARLIFANTLWELAGADEVATPYLRQSARQRARTLWSSVIHEPMRLDGMGQHFAPPDASPPGEYIRNWASTMLERHREG